MRGDCLLPQTSIEGVPAKYPLTERHLRQHHQIRFFRINVGDKRIPGGLFSCGFIGKFTDRYLHIDTLHTLHTRGPRDGTNRIAKFRTGRNEKDVPFSAK